MSQLPEALVAAHEVEREHNRRGADDDVEREEQVRVGAADRDGNPRRHACERGERERPGPAAEDPGPDGDRDGAGHDPGRERAVVARRNQVEHEQKAADRPQREPDTARDPLRRGEEQGEAEATERPADLRSLTHGRLRLLRDPRACTGGCRASTGPARPAL